MKLVTHKEMKNNTYEIELQVLDITDTDKEKISDFGEPIVNVGGVITELGEEITYENVKVAKTELVEKQKVDEFGAPVFELDGFTPVLETVETPVLGEDGLPVMIDKLDDTGKAIYHEVKTPIQVVVADLGKVLCKFPSDFPIKRLFTVAEYDTNEKAEKVALAYVELVKAELQKAIVELNTKVDTFSGVTEEQL